MPTNVLVTGLLAPYASSNYAITDPLTGIDGLRSVADATARNAIASPFRRVGMFVVLQSDLTVWQLNTATNTGTNADWTQFTGGGGGGSGKRTFAWAFALDSDAIVATDISPWVICTGGGTFARWDIAAKVGPVGAALVVDILKSTDHGATFATLWTATPSNRPTIANGGVSATGSTFAVTTFAAGDLLRLDVITVGSTTAGQNVSVAILGTLT
jgi:hypothetical protein